MADEHPTWYQPDTPARPASGGHRADLAWPDKPPPPPSDEPAALPATTVEESVPLPPPLQTVGPAERMLRPQLDPSTGARVDAANGHNPLAGASTGSTQSADEAAAAVVARGGPGWNIRQAKSGPVHPWEQPSGGPGMAPAFAGAGFAAVQSLPWEQKAPARSTRAVFGVAFGLRILLIVAVPVVGFLAWGWHTWLSDLFHTSHTISQPAKVGTLTPITDPTLVSVAQNLSAELNKQVATQSIVAYYGTDGEPQLILVLAKGPHDSPSPADEFQRYAAGMNATGFRVDTAGEVNTQSNGTNFLCAPVVSPNGTTLSTCMWDDYDVIGAVVDMTGQPVGKTYTQAVAARAAGEH